MHISTDLGQQFTAEFDAIGETDWNSELQGFTDATFYQTWAYAAVRCGNGRVSRMVLRQDGRVVALAQIRLHTTPLLPFGIAYVHWGPVWRRTGETEQLAVLRQALSSLRAEFTNRRKLTLRVVPPVYACEAHAPSIYRTFIEAGFSRLSSPAKLLMVDIRPPLESLRKGLNKKWRNQLSAAERSDLRVAEDSGEEALGLYERLHLEMRNRKALKSDDGLAHVLRASSRLPPGLRPRVVLAYRNNRAVAGAVLSTVGKRAIYMFGAIGNDGMRVKASNLVQWHCVAMLKDLGIEHYDLSGISPDTNPGTYHFKAGLCGDNGVETYMGAFTRPSNFLNSAVVRTGLLVRSALRI